MVAKTELYRNGPSGVTESLLNKSGGGGGGRGQSFVWGGWGRPKGRHHNDCFPITFIVHNQKSNGEGGAWCDWGGGGRDYNIIMTNIGCMCRESRHET